MESGYCVMTEITAAAALGMQLELRHAKADIEKIKELMQSILLSRYPKRPENKVLVHITVEENQIKDIRPVGPDEVIPDTVPELSLTKYYGDTWERLGNRTDLRVTCRDNNYKLYCIYDPRWSKYYKGGQGNATESNGQDDVPKDVSV